MDEGIRGRDTSLDESEQISPEVEAGIRTNEELRSGWKFGVKAAGNDEGIWSVKGFKG